MALAEGGAQPRLGTCNSRAGRFMVPPRWAYLYRLASPKCPAGRRLCTGVGPICRALGIAPSTYCAFKAVERDPDQASDRARQDRLDMAEIKQAFEGSRGRYGARKVWHQLRRSGHDIARCTVERLMPLMGLQGVVRGKKVIATNSDTAQPCPDDKVNQALVADMPNQL